MPSDTLSYVYEGVDKTNGDAVLKLSAQVRYNSGYKYKNLLMRVETLRMADTTLVSVDTLCCRIYDDNGRRLGSTAGSIYQSGSYDVVIDNKINDGSGLSSLLVTQKHL